MTSSWFTSDEHYGHNNIIEYSKRPFRDVDHMQDELIYRHNHVVKPSDFVWHLGDFSLKIGSVFEVLHQLNGIHFLIMGNHDRCHPCQKNHEDWRKVYLQYFASVDESFMLAMGPAGATLLHHMPYRSDGPKEEKHAKYRPKDEGGWLLHGHVHEQWKIKDKMINVGVDQWDFAPVSTDELMALMERNGNR